MQSSKLGELIDATFRQKMAAQKQDKQTRMCTYLLISWGLQLLCVMIVGIGLLWGTVQLLRFTNYLGVSQEPPGLVYYIDYPDPPPPPGGT